MTSPHPAARLQVALAIVLLAVAAAFVVRTGPAEAASHSAGGFTTAATVSVAQVEPGGRVTVTATVKAKAQRKVLVDVEIQNATGATLHQSWWDKTTLPAGRTKAFRLTWTVAATTPAAGYTVKVGVFGPNWKGRYHWNDAAAALTVVAPATTTTQAPTTTAAPTTTTTTAAPTTTTTTAPPPPPPPQPVHFATLPVGAELPSGTECATLVRPAPEVREANSTANHTRGGREYANTRPDWSGFDRVDGDFAGTTDEIIQWAACKWGIDEDMVRAQVVKESWWRQSTVGDGGESWGLGQVREPFHTWAYQFSVNARTSSAYNLDYTYAAWRACFEGVYTWLNTVERGSDYGPGDAWGCMGVWYSGRWYSQPAIDYLEGGETPGYGDRGVKQHLELRTWADADFVNG